VCATCGLPSTPSYALHNTTGVVARTLLHSTLTPWDKEMIVGGNDSAHNGDALVDTLLYDGIGARSDTFAFEELYGMHPYEAMKISM